jgi:hypothetical protein
MPVGTTSPIGGVVPGFGNQLIVTGTAGMTVNVDTGLVNMPNSTAWEGMYTAPNTALYSVAVPASNATQWRSDYIVARQHDAAVQGDADNNWDIVDVAGAFSGSAPGTLPSLPNNSVILAIIHVTPNMTVTNGGGTVIDARVFAPLPGVLWTTSSAKPALSCHEGTMWFETDTGALGIIVAGTYKYLFLTSSSLTQIDSWHSVNTLQNGWGFGSGGYFKYRRSLENEIVVAIRNLTPGTVTDGTNVLNAGGIPGIYQPPTFHRRTGWCDAIKTVGGNLEPPAFDFAPDGSIQVYGMAIAAIRFDLYTRLPIDV